MLWVGLFVRKMRFQKKLYHFPTWWNVFVCFEWNQLLFILTVKFFGENLLPTYPIIRDDPSRSNLSRRTCNPGCSHDEQFWIRKKKINLFLNYKIRLTCCEYQKIDQSEVSLNWQLVWSVNFIRSSLMELFK